MSGASAGRDSAHDKKERETGGGERLTPHSAFSDSDQALRAASDAGEAARVAGAAVGYIAEPGTGDYHALRLAAKQAGAGVGSDDEDPAKRAVAEAERLAADARQGAAVARRAASGGDRSAPVQGRRAGQRVATSESDGEKK